MAYRKPAVTVIQEFTGLVPALAAFTLPSISVGPAYQLVNEDLLGTYSGNAQDYAYASKLAGAQVDLEELASDEQFTATKKPISVKMKNAELEVKPSSVVGAGNDTAFSDVTVNRFQGVLPGDMLVIKAITGVAILAPQTNGASSDLVGQRNRLSSGTAGQFADVKTGDSVQITSGTNTVAGIYTVSIKVNDDLLVLSGNINNGSGPSSNVAFKVTGDRGQANEGAYKIKAVSSANAVVLESPLAEKESFISYYVKRAVGTIEIPRSDVGFSADEDKLSIIGNLQYSSMPVLKGMVYGAYRALRNDMAANVREFARLSDLQAFFGVDQINPANPLAFGLSIMLQNTTTPVNGLGLNGMAVEDETLAYQNALDVLAMTEMYAICPLTQSPVIHQILKTHVEGLSAPGEKKERVGIINRKAIKEEIMKEEATLSSLTTGSRIIVNTQVDGAAIIASPKTLNDATVDAFLKVQQGDTVVIVGGSNAVAVQTKVLTKPSNNQITVADNIVTANSSDLQYYIVRKDGLGADGVTFYDRSAAFISNGIAPGYFLRVLSGAQKGSYKITGVSSEKAISVEQVPGVVSLVEGLEYEVYRELSKTEQATVISQYSAGMGSRRMVNIWPDVVKSPVGAVTQSLPGFYAGCAVAAMTTGLPTHQGFTNLTATGFLGLENSSGYFSDRQLDVIADGGTFIFAQEGEETPLFVRHQLTSDRSAIKFQEYSVTKNVDYISKFIRNAFASYIGVFNIVETTMDELKTTATAVLAFLRDSTRLPRIGGVIRNGSLSQLTESTTQIDTVIMRFTLSIPIPLNNLDITIEV